VSSALKSWLCAVSQTGPESTPPHKTTFRVEYVF
jgi:hypothetical protein